MTLLRARVNGGSNYDCLKVARVNGGSNMTM
jgi:hypothetical protein